MIALVAATLIPAAQAQSIALSGIVSDPQGAAMPSVTVTLTSQSAAGRRTTTTDGTGGYRFEGLSAGPYQLLFDRAGFETVTHSGTLSGTSAEVSVSLPVQGSVSSIDVTDVAGKATASRLDTPDRELPVQISSIPRSILQLQGINDMVTAVRNASGVQAQRFYGVYEYFTIRGFNQADVMLVDGMRLEGNRFNTQLNNVESVEILKGPSSVLYGGSALAGVINVIRKKPQGTRAYDLMYRGGRFNTHQVAGGATGPLWRNLLYRADASYDYSDGWRNAGAKRLNVSPSITWLMTERARITVNQAFNRDRYAGDGGLPVGLLSVPNFDLSRRFSTPWDFILVEDSQTQLMFNANLSPTWEFRDGFLLRRTSDEYFVTEGSLNYVPARNEVTREGLYFHHTRRPIQNQADVVGHLNFLKMRHTVLGGYEYQDFYTRTDVPDDGGFYELTPISLSNFRETNPPITNFPVVRQTFQANRIHALYWQDQIDLGSKLKINIGGRFDDYNRQRHRIFTADPNTITGVQTRDQTAYTYRAGIVYSPIGTHQLYFNTASAFTPVIDIPANGAELKPRTGLTYEVGHRWQGFGGRVRTSLAIYHLEQNNLTFRQTPVSVIQAGQQRSRGIDFDLNASLGHQTQLLVNYGFTQPVFTAFDELTGNRPQFVQKHAANAWLTKTWGAGFITSIGTRYLGPMFTDNENTLRLGGWTAFSGAVGYRRGIWETTLNAENLFNRQRYFTGADYSNQVYPGAPINVFVSVRLRFN